MILRHPPLALFFLTLAALVPGIWEATGITGKDEFYLGLRTPMEMMAGDHWLVPFLDGAPRIKKPPLLYWLGRASYETLGVSLFSARLVAVCFAALLVAATAGIARRLSGEARTGWLAGLVLLGCLGLHSEGRRFMLDVPVAALSATALWCTLIWLEKPRWPWLTAATLALAAGFLVKGPIVALVCGAGLAALALGGNLSRRDLAGRWPALAAHGALFLALALPWFGLVRLLYPQAAELALADEVESRQFFHLSPEIALGLVNVAAPWVFVFCAGAWAQRRQPLARLLLAWFLLSFVPFFFLRSFDRYLIGSLVPLAILVAVALPELRLGWPFRLGLAVALLAGGLLAGFAAWFGLGGWYWLPLPAAYLAWAWWRPGRPGHCLAAPIVFWSALLAGVFPALGINAVPTAVVDLGKTRPVAFFDGPQPALLPILAQAPHRHYTRLDRRAATELAGSQALVFCESKDSPRLAEQAAAAGWRAVPAGRYATLASHGSGVRFARLGATAADWREALVRRDLGPLLTTVEWFTLEAP